MNLVMKNMKLKSKIKIEIKGGSPSAIKMARSTLLQLSENDKERMNFSNFK